jgi:hypothetical protein
MEANISITGKEVKTNMIFLGTKKNLQLVL